MNVPAMQRLIAELRNSGITDENVLAAIASVDRERFVTQTFAERAWENTALPIAFGQTISQPLVVAAMTEALRVGPRMKVLEIGTGSGYHAAVLSRIAREVYSIEIVEPIAAQASKRLSTMGYHNVEVRVGDGYRGWPDHAPFDAILLSVAPGSIPTELIKQLRVGGKMVVPVGGLFFQDLLVITKTADGLQKRQVIPVRLAPMTGKAQDGHR